MLSTLSCKNQEVDFSQFKIDIQGHRGCRGLFPENSLPAFKHALQLGVNTLELDVVVSKDMEVVVSHDPFMHHTICLDPMGNRIPKSEQLNYNLYQMDYEEIIQYDCGSLIQSSYPNQKKIKVSKPRLVDVITQMDAFSTSQGLPLPRYNIEIKRKKKWDNTFHPHYQKFVQLIMQVINQTQSTDRSTVQSFDIDVLQYLKEHWPNQENAFLIQNNKSLEDNLMDLGYKPDIYGPTFRLVDNDLMDHCKQKNIKVIPWTVNHENDMKRILQLKVDGIITDYPDRLIQLLKK